MQLLCGLWFDKLSCNLTAMKCFNIQNWSLHICIHWSLCICTHWSLCTFIHWSLCILTTVHFDLSFICSIQDTWCCLSLLYIWCASLLLSLESGMKIPSGIFSFLLEPLRARESQTSASTYERHWSGSLTGTREKVEGRLLCVTNQCFWTLW